MGEGKLVMHLLNSVDRLCLTLSLCKALNLCHSEIGSSILFEYRTLVWVFLRMRHVVYFYYTSHHSLIANEVANGRGGVLTNPVPCLHNPIRVMLGNCTSPEAWRSA